MATSFTPTLTEFIAAIPKVELHLHLEGAIPLPLLFQMIQRKEPHSEIRSLEDLQRKFIFRDFRHFIELWIWKDQFITAEQDFAEITYQVLQQLHMQHVRYAELHYSPGGYEEQGFSIQGITEQILTGKNRADHDFGIRTAFILDLMRSTGPERGREYLEAVTPYLGQGVIGIGLGGPEKEYPADPYADIYQEARKRGFRLTAHAGETDSAHSIRTVLEKLGVERIGHGLRAYEDPALIALLKERQIPLELCVISNVKTGVCQSIETHPFCDYYRQGLLVTTNSDDPAMFHTSLNQEYLTLAQQFGFTFDDLHQVSLNGVEASFLPAVEKQALRTQFEQEWQPLRMHYASMFERELRFK